MYGAGPLRPPPKTPANFLNSFHRSMNRCDACGALVKRLAGGEEVAGSKLANATKFYNAPTGYDDVILSHVATSGIAMWQLAIGCPNGIFLGIFQGIFCRILFF